MNDAGFVRGFEAAGDLPRDAAAPARPAACRRVGESWQVVALNERHRDVLDAVDLAEIVNADDVLVGDLPRQQQFLLEPLLDVRRRAAAASNPVRITFSATATPSSASQAW